MPQGLLLLPRMSPAGSVAVAAVVVVVVVVSSLTSCAFAKALYRRSMQRGEYTKLDWQDAPIPPEFNMTMVPKPKPLV
mgnify:CR=1 FL=1